MRGRDPLNQLTSFRVEVDAERREQDLDAIRTELRRQPPTRPVRRRRWTLGVVVILTLAGPVAAVAGDDAVPGDLLYPIKRAVEPIVQLFDSDVVAEHRVEELATLIARNPENELIDERIAVARDALAATDAPRLEQELDRIVDGWITDRAPHAPNVTDVAPPTTVRPGDESTPQRDDREPAPLPSDAPTTTTSTARQSIGDAPTTDGTTTTTTAPSERDDETRPRDGP